MKKTGLGRGLDALFTNDDILEETEKSGDISKILINDIDPNPQQPRRDFDDELLNELTQSIKEHGILQPILLTKRGNRYIIAAGERRWRASRLAGLNEIPAFIRNFSDEQLTAVALVENLQRDDLNPIEEAEGISSFMKRFDLTQQQVADKLSKSRSAVANTLRLLKLSDFVRKMVAKNNLSAGHARCLLVIDDENAQIALANRILDEDLTVRQVEVLVKSGELNKKFQRGKGELLMSAEMEEFQDMLMRFFDSKVDITGGTDKGRITIHYSTKNSLERVYDYIKELEL